MKNLNLYIEAKDASVDDAGNLCPVGIKVTIAKDVTLDYYEEWVNAIKEVDEKALMLGLNMDRLFDIDKASLITEEEYERNYGDEG